MVQQTLPDSAHATEEFPQFAHLYDMVVAEVEGLADAQLDWESDRWEWSKWSIRKQVSHIASFMPGWLLRRWGGELFYGGTAALGELANYSPSPKGSWLDEAKYRDMPSILKKVRDGMELAQVVLRRETVGSMRRKEAPRPDTPTHWSQFAQAHPTGIRWHPTIPHYSYITLEATFRHLYYEVVTHLYNIQRLKRAQGLPTRVEIPPEGYWVLPGWDRSEP